MGLVVAGAAVLVAVAVGAAILAVDNRPEVSVPLRDIPEGVSFRTVGRMPVFFVRTGGALTAIVGRSTHLREPLHWCEQEHLFHDPRIGGDLFDIAGRKVPGSGPAPRDLDRLNVRIAGEDAVVRLAPLVEGPDGSNGGWGGRATPEWDRAAASGSPCRAAVPPVTGG